MSRALLSEYVMGAASAYVVAAYAQPLRNNNGGFVFAGLPHMIGASTNALAASPTISSPFPDAKMGNSLRCGMRSFFAGCRVTLYKRRFPPRPR
jgi:hypothetical protein